MTSIGFIGLGNMGGPMAANLVKAGHEVAGFDIAADALERAARAGVEKAASVASAVAGREVAITMLPAGEHVRSVWLGGGSILNAISPGTLAIDSSTIDVASAREVHVAADGKGLAMVDAPVSGGVAGAEAGTLTFMVGGSEEAFARAWPVLEAMGRSIFHAGGPGAGQVAKMCNNMILGVSMIAVGEAFVLAERLGLDHQRLFDIVSAASGQCWSLTSYCPVPGPVPASPANRGYTPGFTSDMMLKDLRLARAASADSGAATALGSRAEELYARYCESGNGASDFSGIIRMIRESRDGS